MVDSIYGGGVPSRNRAHERIATFPAPCDTLAAATAPCASAEPTNPAPMDYALLGHDEQVAVLAAVDQGFCELGELVRVIPNCPSPISALLALVDAGLLAIDLQSPFGPNVQLWRPAFPHA